MVQGVLDGRQGFVGVDVSDLPLSAVESFVESQEDAYLERKASHTYVGTE